MDQRELRVDHAEAFRAAFFGLASEQWHCMPATVVSYDPVKLTVIAQSTVKMKFRQPDGSQVWNAPVFTGVLVCFPSGGPFVITWPLNIGDEILVVFADRCVDSWWAAGTAGGPQLPSELRLHSNGDGFALLSPRSVPNIAGPISTTNLQIRSVDGATLIELTPAGQINIVAPEGLAMASNVVVHITVGGTTFSIGPAGIAITGNIIVTGTVTADAFIVPPPV